MNSLFTYLFLFSIFIVSVDLPAQEETSVPSTPPSASDLAEPSPRPKDDKFSKDDTYFDKEDAERLAGVSGGSNSSDWKFHLAVYYNTAAEGRSEGTVTINSSPFTFDTTEKTSGAIGFAVGAVKRSSEKWGVDLGVGVEASREVDSTSGTVAGISSTSFYSAPKPEFTLSYLFANGRYYINNDFNLSFGMNVSRISIDNSEINFNAGIGFQVGAAFNISSSVAIFSEYKTYLVTAEESGIVSGNSYFADYDYYDLTGAVVGLAFSF